MESAIAAFAALAHPLRLRALRALIAAGPDGLPAGEVARLLDRPANTLSAVLSQLERAGLAESARDGRQVIYRAVIPAVGRLAGFLVDDCCGGQPEACFPPRSPSAPASKPEGAP